MIGEPPVWAMAAARVLLESELEQFSETLVYKTAIAIAVSRGGRLT